MKKLYSLIFQSHLNQQFPVWSGMSETRGVVIFIQDGDVGSASGTAWRRTPVLYDHNKLVAGLLFSVQGKAGADLTLSREREKDRRP